jgi:putative colanic acid biosynthesis acetyltransferase WcaF
MQNLKEFKLPPGFRGKPGWYVQLWWIVEACLFKPSPQVCYGWRRFLLRMFGAKIGRKVIVRPSVTTTFPWKVSIGDYSWIGDNVVLYSLGPINIGNNVVISQKSYLCGGTHDYKIDNFPIFGEPITIEDECWIATDVFIGPGVKIETGAVVGARYTGSPAKPLRKRI